MTDPKHHTPASEALREAAELREQALKDCDSIERFIDAQGVVVPGSLALIIIRRALQAHPAAPAEDGRLAEIREAWDEWMQFEDLHPGPLMQDAWEKLDKAIKRNTPAQAPSPWRSMDTAPKDGTRIVAKGPGIYPVVVRWEQSLWVMDHCSVGFQPDMFDAWMPLPQSPSPAKEE